ncbi:hypothetical protein HAX54_053104, partial [Datura stramonium]|nr:hypothetical protein [Datura stramonium]
IMFPISTASNRNETNIPQQSRMKTRNGSYTLFQGSNVGIQDGLTSSGRFPSHHLLSLLTW